MSGQPAGKLFDAESGEIKAKNLFFFSAFLAVLLADRDYFPDDLDIKSSPLGLAINFFDVIGESFLFFFEFFDALDESAQMTRVDVFGAGAGVVDAHAQVRWSVR
jgi:hypothetical protein